MAAHKTIRAPDRTAKRGTAPLQSRRPERHDLIIPIVQSDDRFERIPGFAGTHSGDEVAPKADMSLGLLPPTLRGSFVASTPWAGLIQGKSHIPLAPECCGQYE